MSKFIHNIISKHIKEVECSCCYTSEEFTNLSENEIQRRLLRRGWSYIHTFTKEGEIDGLVCPKCLQDTLKSHESKHR